MTAALQPVAPFDIVIFGGTGDLSLRKLLPALYHRYADGQIPDDSRVVAVARDGLDDAEFRERVRGRLLDPAAGPQHAERLERFLRLVEYTPIDALGERGWADLAARLGERTRVRVFYLATAPELFAPICERLRMHALNSAESRVVIEKPIGRDRASANAINDAVGHSFDERQIYRIDHYLGKETVQNLIALRFGNALFEPLWKAAHIDHVQITVAETLGVEGRAGYYDRAGAARDMLQNHLLQLLCMIALEPPASLDPDALRDEKLKVLRALRPIVPADAAQNTVRGQYRSGASEHGPVPGYRDEVGRGDTVTETFVAIKAQLGNWRWAGVPFYLRTGKRLPQRVSEIVIQFRAIPHSIFAGVAGDIASNKLVVRLQPDEGVRLWLMLKEPGPGGLRLRQVPLDMSFAEHFSARYPDAYERLLMDVVRGNLTLFMRRDEVEAAWDWVDPIIRAWEAQHDAPKPYTAGTWGPSAAVALIERDGRTWHEDA